MTGFTLNARQTSLLADIVDALTVVDSDVPLPWDAMHQIGRLLGADSVQFGGYDTLLPHLWFGEQFVDRGQQERTEPESPVEARDNPFWQTYWEGFCSHPDRSGDFDTVTTLADFINLADIHANADGVERNHERHISLYIRGRTPGRHLRLIGCRERGSNFTDRDRFFLKLLRPHLANAFQSGSLARPEPTLTRRQLEVMTMVEAGMTNRQIARRVGLSEGTVRTHLENIYARLDVSSRTAAVHRVFGSADNWL